MDKSPFRPCDYCHTKRNTSGFWTIHNTTRKLSCPDCSQRGRLDDERAARVIRQYRWLLKDRLLADAEATYGNPVHLQYARIKEQYPDIIVLFRDGDQYAALAGDAEALQQALGLVPSRVFVGHEPVLLVRFPAHALDIYLPALVRAGHRVGLCDPHASSTTSSVAAEPFGDAPLPCTHYVVFRGHPETYAMHLADGRYYSLDGTWDVSTEDPSIRSITRKAFYQDASSDGHEQQHMVAAEPVGRYEAIERNQTIERLSTIITVLNRHGALPPTEGVSRFMKKYEQELAEERLKANAEALRAELKLHRVWLCRWLSLHFRLVRAKVNVPPHRLPAILDEYKALCRRADREPWPLHGAPARAIGNFETSETQALTLQFAEEALVTAQAFTHVPQLRKHFEKHLHAVRKRIEDTQQQAA
jgi:hypothetical protein